MNFVYPGFLWGLLAIAIPIVIHLFNFKRAKKIYFSNVSFLEHVKESSSSKLKLKHLLVLLSRILVICFLVFAFAQPYLPGNEKGLDSNLVRIYLDNSQSTSNLSVADQSGLSFGLGLVEAIIDLYPAETLFQIFNNDFGAHSTTPKSKEESLDLIAEFDYSDLSRNKQEILSKLVSDVATASKSDIYIISDFQKSSFETDKQTNIDSLNSYRAIPIMYSNHSNILVDSLFLENPFLVSGELNRLHLKIRNLGNEATNDLIVKLFVNDLQSASASVDIDPNTSSELIFDLNFELENFNACKIIFEDFPLTFDNEYFFTLSILRKILVTQVKSEHSGEYLEHVYGDNDLFQFQTYRQGNVDYAVASSSDLLIVDQLDEIDNSITNLANDLLSKGKSVLVIPSPNVGTESLKPILGNGVRLVDGKEKVKLENPDLANPFFDNIFLDVDNKTEMPESANLISWSSGGIDLLTLKTGVPFLNKTDRIGALYCLSAPLNDTYTNFHKHALFVPVLYRIAALSSHSHYPLSYSIDDPIITVKVDSLVSESLFKLSRADEEYIPAQRINGNHLILDLPKFLLSPGFYELTYNDQLKNILAFNHSKRESDPTQMTREEIRSSLNSLRNLEIMDSVDATSFSQEMKERYEGLQLWKYALILSLIFLLTETLFLRFL